MANQEKIQLLNDESYDENISEFEKTYKNLITDKEKLSKTLTYIDTVFEPRLLGCAGRYMWKYYFCPGTHSQHTTCCSTTHITMHILFLALISILCMFLSTLINPSLELYIVSLGIVIIIFIWEIWQFNRRFQYRTDASTIVDKSFSLIVSTISELIKVDEFHLLAENTNYYRDNVKKLKCKLFALLSTLALISILAAVLLIIIEIEFGASLALSFVFYMSGLALTYLGMHFVYKYGVFVQNIVNMLSKSITTIQTIVSRLSENANGIENETVDIGDLSLPQINKIKNQTKVLIGQYYDLILAHRYGKSSIYSSKTTITTSVSEHSEIISNIESVPEEDHQQMLELVEDNSSELSEPKSDMNVAAIEVKNIPHVIQEDVTENYDDDSVEVLLFDKEDSIGLIE